jgi:hypothetical protein
LKLVITKKGSEKTVRLLGALFNFLDFNDKLVVLL